MVKPFNDYVFNNRVGRIGLVETDFGFHVIKIVAKEDLVKVATLALRNIPSEKLLTQYLILHQSLKLIYLMI